MSQDTCIAVDVMGGDLGSRPCVMAVQDFLYQYPRVSVVLYGREPEISPLLDSALRHRVHIEHCASEISMDATPSAVLKQRGDSSMVCAIAAVAAGTADVCVSGGNTGALLALGCHHLTRLLGVRRPAICKRIPSVLGRSYLLDLGANVDCSPEQLQQFALMGVSLAHAAGMTAPKVALLNIGSEPGKGNQLVQASYARLRHLADDMATPLFDLVGFVEADQLFSGIADVIVCDGFTGNIALKASEGTASFIFDGLRQHFGANIWRRLQIALAGPGMRQWIKGYQPSLYNGAPFLGLAKPLVKSHGGADRLGFYTALEVALDVVEQDLCTKVSVTLAKYRAAV